MCLILLAIDAIETRPWLLLGNRDEFHGRASAAAAAWDDRPDIVGGRDLVAGGSWLALNRNGRFAAVTNVRVGGAPAAARSRGELVGGFVGGAVPAPDYVHALAARVGQYGPFNLVVGDHTCVWGLSSTDALPWRLEAGLHVLSNGPPTVQWPKARRLHDAFAATIKSANVDDAALLDLLADTAQPPDDELPHTGIGLEREKFLAPIFIRGREYGTRASTLAYACGDALVLSERRFGADGAVLGATRLALG